MIEFKTLHYTEKYLSAQVGRCFKRVDVGRTQLEHVSLTEHYFTDEDNMVTMARSMALRPYGGFYSLVMWNS